MKRFECPADASAMQRVTAFIEDTLDAADVSMRDKTKIMIVADEVLNNIIAYSGARTVSVALGVAREGISLEFRDDGRPYDPTVQPEPDVTLSAEDREIGGLGVFMVKKLMDRVEYTRDGAENALAVFRRTAE